MRICRKAFTHARSVLALIFRDPLLFYFRLPFFALFPYASSVDRGASTARPGAERKTKDSTINQTVARKSLFHTWARRPIPFTCFAAQCLHCVQAWLRVRINFTPPPEWVDRNCEGNSVVCVSVRPDSYFQWNEICVSIFVFVANGLRVHSGPTRNSFVEKHCGLNTFIYFIRNKCRTFEWLRTALHSASMAWVAMFHPMAIGMGRIRRWRRWTHQQKLQ